MLQNPCKTLGFMKNMVYKIPPGGGGGGGKPYPASGLIWMHALLDKAEKILKIFKPWTAFPAEITTVLL